MQLTDAIGRLPSAALIHPLDATQRFAGNIRLNIEALQGRDQTNDAFDGLAQAQLYVVRAFMGILDDVSLMSALGI
jgi:hypothetical protein